MIQCKVKGASCVYSDGVWTSDVPELSSMLSAQTEHALSEASPLGGVPDKEWAEANAVMEFVGGEVVSKASPRTFDPNVIY